MTTELELPEGIVACPREALPGRVTLLPPDKGGCLRLVSLVIFKVAGRRERKWGEWRWGEGGDGVGRV